MSHKPTITDSLEFPQDSMIPRAAFGLGFVGLIASFIGAYFNADQFFFSYIVSFTFFGGIALSALISITLIFTVVDFKLLEPLVIFISSRKSFL